MLDIDKTWEGILYLLTGYNLDQIENATPPLSWALFSGQIIGEELDMGYGPANYCLPDQVKTIAAALRELPSETLKQRFDPTKCNNLKYILIFLPESHSPCALAKRTREI